MLYDKKLDDNFLFKIPVKKDFLKFSDQKVQLE